MVPPPLPLSLILCDYVHREEGPARKMSLIGTFTQLRVASFPATPTFYLYAALTKVYLPVTTCSFSQPAWYQGVLLIDGDWVAQAKFRVST
jgi:hypothetical protein